MKDFIKMFFASCLGVMLGMVMLAFIIMTIASALATSKSKLETDGILVLDFKESITEKTGNIESTPFAPIINNIGLRDYSKVIQKAIEDNMIKGILIKNPEPSMGQASMYSIMDDLKDFKESGKFIYAYADYYGQGGYFCSSIADSIFLNPNGMIDIRGYATMIPFFKEGLDRLGVKFDIFYAGDFKSATEPFRLTEMSEENKLQTRAFLNEMLDIMLEEVADNRDMKVEDFHSILSDYKGSTAESAMQVGIIDAISYWNDIEIMLKEKVGVSADKKLKLTGFMDYKANVSLIDKGPSSKKIAIVYAEGNVGYGKHQKGSITDREYIKIFSKIRRDDKIKAVVLRVNSGGGSALTSDIIWDEIEKTKSAGKPVIASFGDYAASGGYYIAAGADAIVSQPNTLTGSIGVFSMLPNVSKLFKNKFGITFDSVQTHDMAIGYSGVFDLSKKERAILKSSTDRVYETFLDRVASGRNMTKEEVHKIAQGRVWTGAKAQEIGLVDELGDIDKAIEIAAEKVDLEKYKLIEYPFIKKDPFEEIINELMKGMNDGEDAMITLSKQNKELVDFVLKNKEVLETEGPQSRLLYKMKTN
jgi:protease-4